MRALHLDWRHHNTVICNLRRCGNGFFTDRSLQHHLPLRTFLQRRDILGTGWSWSKCFAPHSSLEQISNFFVSDLCTSKASKHCCSLWLQFPTLVECSTAGVLSILSICMGRAVEKPEFPLRSEGWNVLFSCLCSFIPSKCPFFQRKTVSGVFVTQKVSF